MPMHAHLHSMILLW